MSPGARVATNVVAHGAKGVPLITGDGGGTLRSGGAMARHYEGTRRVLVTELCSGGVGLAVRNVQLGALLAFAADVGASAARVFELPDTDIASWVVRTIGAPKQVRVGRPGSATERAWVQVDDPVRVLSRFGYRGGRWTLGGPGDAVGTLRGAIGTAGQFTREGVRISCPSPRSAVTAVELLERVGITAERPGGVEVVIAWTAVCAALSRLGLPATAAAYGRVLDAEFTAEHAAVVVKAAAYKAVLRDCNTDRAQVAAATEADRIASLGDLSVYGLPKHLHRVAEIRRDHRDLNYSQAAAVLGVSKDTFTGRIRRFWQAIDTATTGCTA
jgi:hypothetical protein